MSIRSTYIQVLTSTLGGARTLPNFDISRPPACYSSPLHLPRRIVRDGHGIVSNPAVPRLSDLSIGDVDCSLC